MPFDATPVDTDPTVLALQRAKRRIEDKRNWCQGAYHLDGRMCALGALGQKDFTAVYSAEHRALDDASEMLFGLPSVWQINDLYDHAAVMRIYDLAIEMARERAMVTG